MQHWAEIGLLINYICGIEKANIYVKMYFEDA